MTTSLDLATLRQAYAAGCDPVDVIADVYRRIEAASDPGIFLSLVPQEKAVAMAQALGAYDAAKPLWGAPFAIKDNIDLAGLPTTAGCPAFAYQPKESAFAVQRLIEAGTIPIGKTNLDQFATGLIGLRTPGVAPKNSFEPSVVPGGSSSGSAVAVARDLVTFALGTDTAGSGRVPAALNNLVGLKPSVGVVSSRGMVPACKSLDCMSIFAGATSDAWDIYRVLTGRDDADAFQRPLAFGPLGAPPPHWRCGVPKKKDLEFFGDDAARTAWEASVKVLAGMGASFIEIDMEPFLAVARLLYEGPWVAERHAAMRAFLATNADDVMPVTRGIVSGALRFTATDAFEASYKLRELEAVARKPMAGIDALVVPSIPCVVRVEDVARDPLGPNARLGRWTNFVNLLDMCAFAAPGPFRPDGLPAGVTFIAPHGADARVAALGGAFHALSGVGFGAARHAVGPVERATPTDGFIEIVVVGAHMSGMALNGELTALGGVFDRSVKTEASYRFHALAGGPPKRPGLIRCADGKGKAIDTEVWRLPPEGFGRFVASIPAPLGIGTIRLADGSRPKGFLAEPEGLVGAQDISEYGGWRAFVASSI